MQQRTAEESLAAKRRRFATPEEAAAFVETHDMVEHWDELEEAEPRHFQPATSVARRLVLEVDEEVLRRLRVAARPRGIGYHALARMYLLERLREAEAAAAPAAPASA